MPAPSHKERIELDQLRQIFHNINENIWIITLDGPEGPYFSFVSDKNAAHLGPTDEPLQGMLLKRFVEKFIHEDDRHIYARRDTERKTGSPSELTVRIRYQDTREIRWMRVRTFPMVENDGSYRRSVGLVEDITERILLEQNFEIERQKQVRSAKMAAIGMLAAEVSHDINNPLSVIQAYADQLIESKNQPSIQESVPQLGQKISLAAHKIHLIVQSLLAYSRKSETDPPTVVSLSEPFDAVMSLVNHTAKGKGIEIKKMGVDPAQIKLMCRPGQMIQLFNNLMQNAIDGCENAPTRWVSVEFVDKLAENRFQVRISNPGEKIDPKIVDKLTEPFFTTKQPGKGTGLGLYICKNIVGQYGGRLWYEPSLPHTTFIVELDKATETSA